MYKLYALMRRGLKTIWIQVALLYKGFVWRGNMETTDEPVV